MRHLFYWIGYCVGVFVLLGMGVASVTAAALSVYWLFRLLTWWFGLVSPG